VNSNAAGADKTVIVSLFVKVSSSLVTVTLMGYVPALVGVPLNAPLVESVSPSGTPWADQK
jgi:hypothetical protein